MSTISSTIALNPPDELFVLDTDMWTEPYWNACREHRLTVAQCASCGTYRIPPRPFCANCTSQEITWKDITSGGVIYSFCIVNVAIVDAMRGHVPYVPAIISLPDAGDVRLISNIVDCPVGDIRIGATVRLVWHDRPDAISVPRFTMDEPA